MNEIRAFVGHSFIPEEKDIFTPTDEEVVGTFLRFFDEVSKLHQHFSWEHAARAQSTGIDDKVLSISANKNVFIGICTKKERVISEAKIRFTDFWKKRERAVWKTSDWIIQEIGLSIGRGCKIILLIESGVRNPGGLQGSLEYIEFDRTAPERAFEKLLQMLTHLAPTNTAVVPVQGTTVPDSNQMSRSRRRIPIGQRQSLIG